MKPDVHAFFDRDTFCVTYVVRDPVGTTCAVIDPVLDFDPASGHTGTHAADSVIGFVREQGLEAAWILETHIHADHLSGAPYVKDALGGKVGIGAHVAEVQRHFAAVFGAEPGFRSDGSQFDRLFGDGDRFVIGGLEGRVLHTPGHTPACLTYVIGDAAFVGDTLFMPDSGTARCDFPGGSARTLYRSIHRVLDLPPETRIFVCHDYGNGGKRDYAWETTVAEERASNIHVKDGTSEDAYVAMREARDATLTLPRLILPSIQVNMRAGHLPPADESGAVYLKIPINRPL